MIDHFKEDRKRSVRQTCSVLGFRRQTYYSRKGGKPPEELDQYIADLLHKVTRRFVAWGFWMVFYYLRKQGHPWNHKRIYRIWKAEDYICAYPRNVPRFGANIWI